MDKNKVYSVSQECETHVWRKSPPSIFLIFLSTFTVLFLLGCGLLACINYLRTFLTNSRVQSDKK